MIIDAIFAVLIGFVDVILGLVTSLVPTVPGWFVDAAAGVSTLMGYVWLFDAWLPVQLMLTIAGAVFAAWGVAVVIGGVRWIVSYFLGGGGAT